MSISWKLDPNNVSALLTFSHTQKKKLVEHKKHQWFYFYSNWLHLCTQHAKKLIEKVPVDKC